MVTDGEKRRKSADSARSCATLRIELRYHRSIQKSFRGPLSSPEAVPLTRLLSKLLYSDSGRVLRTLRRLALRRRRDSSISELTRSRARELV
ncbi:hypothetical protein TYRP_012426 [Tyrophagus putrescentiae]|nr:hypothetical protein TYRP_012426 [Tyrophagus putrescentiae]